jgi:hypothetical protein
MFRLISLFWWLVKWIPMVSGTIKILVEYASAIGRWAFGRKRTKENFMENLSVAEKASLVAALKETQEWVNFIAHVEKIVITHLTDKCGDKWYMEAGQIVADIVAQCSQEVVDAFTGSANIPAEWKASTTADKIQFAIEILIQQGVLISGIFLPKPSVPAEPTV